MSMLVLLRHGQASFGADDYDQLSAMGERQSYETGVYFARSGERFDEVLVGPRRRHRATAERVLAALPSAPAAVTVDALDEFADGSDVLRAAHQVCGLSATQIAALPRVEQLRQYEATIIAWLRGEARIEGRPTAVAFRATVAGWLRDLAARPVRGQRVLAVTSAGVIAAAVAETLDIAVEHMAQFTGVVRNASMTEIVFSPGRVSLMSFNGITHLPAELATNL